MGRTGTSSFTKRLRNDLSLVAWLYILTVTAVAAAAVAWAPRGQAGSAQAILLTAVLALGATVSQLSEVRTPNNKAYVATIAFLMAGALLLPPIDAAAVVPLPFVVEMLAKRKPPYIQLFNVSSQIVCTLGASVALHLVAGSTPGQQLAGTPRDIAAIGLALAVFLVVNHCTVALAVWLARGVQPRRSGLFTPESIVADVGLLALGVVVAGLWSLAPALVAFAAVPFILLQRALHFPALRQASRTDSKTGLANAAWFNEQAEGELRRAARLGHPVSVLVADLDLLRNINNAYGHLAGDSVLRGVADVLRREVREYDIPSRFGGEEFAVLLPGSDTAEAIAVAERIRREVGREHYEVPTSVDPLHVTVSVGVATFGEHGDTLKELLHAADLALYRAKIEGRDRVRAARAGEDKTSAPGAAVALAAPVAPSARLLAPGNVASEATSAQPPARLPEEPGSSEVSAASGWGGEAEPAPAGDPGKQSSLARRRTWPVTILVTLAAAVAAGLLLRGQAELGLAVAVFPLLAFGAEQLREAVYSSGFTSLSAVPLLAAVATGHPTAAIAAALAAGLGQALALRGKRRFEQHLFNVANVTLATAVTSRLRMLVVVGGPPAHQLPILIPLSVGLGLVFYLVNNGLVAVVVARDERRRLSEVFRHDLGWLAPHFAAYGLLAALLGAAWNSFSVWGIAVFLVPVLLLRVAQHQYLSSTTRHVRELRRLAEDLAASNTQVEATNEKLETALRSVSQAHRRTASALAGAIDARDAITGGHIERVTALGMELCQLIDPALAADPQVAFGFLLHDVGKIGVPDAVLMKQGPLDDDERLVMRQHPEIGERLVRAAGFADVAREIVINHHERWDGGGYPRGLRGTEIPLCARLFSVADSLDAMVSDRPYRRGMPLEAALDELRSGAGSQFDPMAVEAVLSLDPARVIELLRIQHARLRVAAVG